MKRLVLCALLFSLVKGQLSIKTEFSSFSCPDGCCNGIAKCAADAVTGYDELQSCLNETLTTCKFEGKAVVTRKGDFVCVDDDDVSSFFFVYGDMDQKLGMITNFNINGIKVVPPETCTGPCTCNTWTILAHKGDGKKCDASDAAQGADKIAFTPKIESPFFNFTLKDPADIVSLATPVQLITSVDGCSIDIVGPEGTVTTDTDYTIQLAGRKSPEGVPATVCLTATAAFVAALTVLIGGCM